MIEIMEILLSLSAILVPFIINVIFSVFKLMSVTSNFSYSYYLSSPPPFFLLLPYLGINSFKLFLFQFLVY
jgi:hypothetical protein